MKAQARATAAAAAAAADATTATSADNVTAAKDAVDEERSCGGSTLGLSTGALIGVLCAGFLVATVVAAYLMSVCTKRMEKSMSRTDAAPPEPESPMTPRVSEEGTLAPSVCDISKHV
ncbi:hypothetical protein LPJ53_003676 [Coemansia erecta]|uniref:Uncharacterized protein n=1 Tax=Coemansia erecta TaxID=147472 RepID=A0A9W8CRR2_9FUNG|nr:hypothetical protein LPJ53_003676 [Coemansia erecta]